MRAPELMASHPLFEGLLGDDRVRQVLSDAPQSYLTVLTSTGPHATPQVFLAWAGRIWLMTGRDTVKAKVLGPRPGAAVLAASGDQSVVIAGDACRVDPLRPQELLRCVPEVMLSGPAAAGYLARNPVDLLGFVRDALGGKLHVGIPSPPLLVAVRPQALALVRGRDVVAAEGEWPGRREAPPGAPPVAADQARVGQLLSDAPAAAARLLRDERPCVVGWERPTGPLGLPGTWHGERQVASVSSELFGLANLAPDGRASLTLDAIDERHPTAKLGVVVRGRGTATAAPHAMEVRVQPERVTWWQGTDRGTRDVA